MGNFYNEQAKVEVPDAAERKELSKLVEEAEKLFLEKFTTLDCASEPEEGEE